MIKPDYALPMPHLREEADRVKFGDEVAADLRQLKKLVVDPSLSFDELRHRMSVDKRTLKKLLKILGDPRA
jgi:hypothetical protein